VIDVLPSVSAVARPFDPAALLIAATFGVVELQATDVVRSCVKLSVYVPIAAYCRVKPTPILGVVGDTEIDTSVAGVTVRVTAGETTAPKVAVTLVVPVFRAVARPLKPAALLIVATLTFAELHTTVVVMFRVELSEYVPVAVNCVVSPLAILGAVGVAAIDCNVAAATVRVVVPDTPAWLAVMVVVPALTAVT
jgi:hypothetical protein